MVEQTKHIEFSIEKRNLSAGLYLVGTPIGYLKDISLRALETLMSVDVVACEDTRVTGKLLHHYGIQVKKIKYNDHSDSRARDEIIKRIGQGEAVALCSDAGLPLIADPGYKLVTECLEKGAYVTSVPGASAVLTGLQLSGLPTDQFIFLGFMPSKKKAKEDTLLRWKDLPMTHIYYETAPRIFDTVKTIQKSMGERHIVIARELTKTFEEILSGTCADILVRLKDSPIKGEVVLMISGQDGKVWTEEDVMILLRGFITEENFSVKESVQSVMDISGLAKKTVYEYALKVKNE